MSRINEKMGFKPAGAKRWMKTRLSGVRCSVCTCPDVRHSVVHGVRSWRCASCSHAWEPTADEIAAYNARVRERDRIEVP